MFQRFKNEILISRYNFEKEYAQTETNDGNEKLDDHKQTAIKPPKKEDCSGIVEDNKVDLHSLCWPDNETDSLFESEENTETCLKGTQSQEQNSSHQKKTKLQQLLKRYNVQYLNDAIGRPTKSPKIICPICSKILSALSFSAHLQMHNGNREYNFMCEVCSKKCFSNAELIVHRR